MKKEELTMEVFVADDGTKFLDRKKCEEYEEFVLKNVRYFLVNHTPDLNETGLFCYTDVLAVYSECGYHREIAEMWCVRDMKYPILGPSVQGFGYQRHFEIIDGVGNEYVKRAWEEFEYKGKSVNGNTRYAHKVFLSPKRVEWFPNNSDYVERWFGKK